MNDNKLIAEFMGYPKIANDEDKRDYLEDCVKYHTSWDWLMPVIEKIEEQNELIGAHILSTDIGKTYHGVVKFIKTYKDEQ